MIRFYKAWNTAQKFSEKFILLKEKHEHTKSILTNAVERFIPTKAGISLKALP
jgi:hypothetical protein